MKALDQWNEILMSGMNEEEQDMAYQILSRMTDNIKKGDELMKETVVKNPLGAEPIDSLLKKFAVPSIIAMLVSALYNIVDQFFIGRSVGELGNAATNIAFPLSISCIAIALMFGIGGASAFNLAMGRREKKKPLITLAILS